MKKKGGGTCALREKREIPPKLPKKMKKLRLITKISLVLVNNDMSDKLLINL